MVRESVVFASTTMNDTATLPLHQCQCAHCQQGTDHPEHLWHEQINLLMSRLDEQQRRWLIAVEANRLGHGGMNLMSQVSGLHVNTIRRGKRELSDKLETRPIERVRLSGGGRKAVEKKA